MARVTNVSVGPRFVNGANGPVTIQPGQTVEVELSEVERKNAEATGYFSFADAPAQEQGAPKEPDEQRPDRESEGERKPRRRERD